MDFLQKAFDRLTGKKLDEIKSAADQPQDEVDLVTYVKNKVQEIRNSNSRVSHEGVWMTNYAYLLGFDSVYYDTQTKQYRVVGRNTSTLRRNRIHVNKILPTVQRRQARLCKNPPRYEVRPDSASQDARDQARLEQQILEMYFEKERVSEKRSNMMPGLMQCGHFYMGVNWNTEKGELLQSKKEVVLENGTKSEEIDHEYEGDLDVELVHPLEMFPDPLATSLEECSYVIRAKVRKLDYFKSRYGERGMLVKEEDAWLLSSQYEMRIQSLTGQGPAQTGIQMQMKNCAIELVLYEKRSKKHPNGRLVIVANDILLDEGELPTGEIPFVKFDDIPITGKFYSEAIVTHLRPIQDQYNRVISARAEWTNKLLAGKYFAAKGAQLQQEAMTDRSGEIVYYTPVPNAPNAGAPTQMSIPVIPQYAYAEEDKLNAMFYDIAGEGEISRGILPSASVPAIGMQLLLEQDETRISAMTQQHEHAFAKLGALMLKYLEKFCTNERLLKISDPNSQYLVKKWSGTQLKSKHDVIVVKGSLAPSSKASKRNDIMNLFTQGLLGDPNDPQTKAKVLQYLEFGDLSNVWAKQATDMTQIKKSIEMIELGLIPEVDEFDNHALHLQEKNEYRKSDKFAALDAERQAILKNNMEEHLNYLLNAMNPQPPMPPPMPADVLPPEGELAAEDQLSLRLDEQQPI